MSWIKEAIIKGIILAGGMGTRLLPLTKVTNKCLLPVYDRPMIYWPIETLVNSGITDVLLVCGGNSAGDFLKVLGDGKELGLNSLTYVYQKEAKGVAHALSFAEQWAGQDDIIVILADNLFQCSISEMISDFTEGARIFLTEAARPEFYGVAEVDTAGNVLSLEEKPKHPKSNLIVTGLYVYDNKVWDLIKQLKPSARNELEITDLNKTYMQMNKLSACKINGWWADCGESIDGYMQTCYTLSQIKKKP